MANQWRSVLREGRDPIKERNRQKREAISNLYYLKDIALDVFESRKAELKNDGKDKEAGLHLYAFIRSILSSFLMVFYPHSSLRL